MNTLRPAAPSSEGAGFAAVLCRLDVPESVSEANLGPYGCGRVQDAGVRGGDLGLHLHRLEYDDRFVGGDRRTVVDQPSHDGAGDDRDDRVRVGRRVIGRLGAAAD